MTSELVFNESCYGESEEFFQRYSLITKLMTCQKVGYRLLRFANSSGRLVTLSLQDCCRQPHHMADLPPEHSVLFFAPMSAHVWTATDTNNHTSYVFDSVRGIGLGECTFSITKGLLSLRELAVDTISESVRMQPYAIHSLRLPPAIQHEVLKNTVPAPFTSTQWAVGGCACRVKMPIILYCNPYLTMSSRLLTETHKAIDNYVNIGDLSVLLLNSFKS